MINALLIDKDSSALKRLEKSIRRMCPKISINGKADSLTLANQLIAENHPQIVFIDVAWPSPQGFAFLSQFPPSLFETIIVTNEKSYALKAIQCCIAGYVLKPVQREELLSAVKVAQQRIYEKQFLKNAQKNLKRTQDEKEKLIGIPSMEGYEIVKVKEMIRCESLQRCTRIVTTIKKDIISSYSIGEFKKMLNQFPVFFSPHRGHIVNLHFVDKFKHAGALIMQDGAGVPVTKAKKKEFLELLLLLR